jgi:hypothetical protein
MIKVGVETMYLLEGVFCLIQITMRRVAEATAKPPSRKIKQSWTLRVAAI